MNVQEMERKFMEPCIGTSGWHYGHWREVFYPVDLVSSRWLAFYATHFDYVEINNSFYRFPSQENIRTWLAETPPQFRFALKASRYITHQKKLKFCWHRNELLPTWPTCGCMALSPMLIAAAMTMLHCVAGRLS